MKTFDDLAQNALGMTGFFETSSGYPDCYGVTAGNFDGQGLSHGVMQYNFGTGSLQPLWTYLDTNFNSICTGIFGADYTTWHNILGDTTANQVSWGDSISVKDANGNAGQAVIEPWNTYFMNLGTTQESIDKQVDMSKSWQANANTWFNNLGLYSRRGWALLWDINVQMGRLFPQNLLLEDFSTIDTTGKTRADVEKEKMQFIIDRCSNGNNRVFPTTALPNMQQIVHDRKQAILDGTSTQGFDITQYDLDFDPALRGGILID
jgi:hypothetical protein